MRRSCRHQTAAFAVLLALALPLLAGLTPAPEMVCFIRDGVLYRGYGGDVRSSPVVDMAAIPAGPGLSRPLRVTDYVWSADGTRLLIVVSGREGTKRVFATSKQADVIGPVLSVGSDLAAFSKRGRKNPQVALSPDGKRALISVAEPGSAFATLFLTNLELDKSVPTNKGTAPLYAPDGAHAAFSLETTAAPEGGPDAPLMFALMPSSAEPLMHPETRQIGTGHDPVFSQDGRRIAWVERTGGRERLLVSDTDIIKAEPVSAAEGVASISQVAFDGAGRLYWIERRYGGGRLMRAADDGSGSEEVFVEGAVEFALPPQAGKVAFTRLASGRAKAGLQVFSIGSDRRGERRISPASLDGQDCSALSFSPASRYVAFTSRPRARGAAASVWTVAADGRVPARVAADGTAVAWQPFYGPFHDESGPSLPGTGTGGTFPWYLAALAVVGIAVVVGGLALARRLRSRRR